MPLKITKIVTAIDPASPKGDFASIVQSMFDEGHASAVPVVVQSVADFKATTPLEKAMKFGALYGMGTEGLAKLQAFHKPKMAEVDQAQVSMIDELVSLDEFMQEYGVADKMKRMDELKKTLQSVANEMEPDKEAVLEGDYGTVTFSARANKVKITSQQDLRAKLGEETYSALAEVGLSDAKKYLSPLELAQVSTMEYGSRSLRACTKK